MNFRKSSHIKKSFSYFCDVVTELQTKCLLSLHLKCLCPISSKLKDSFYVHFTHDLPKLAMKCMSENKTLNRLDLNFLRPFLFISPFFENILVS